MARKNRVASRKKDPRDATVRKLRSTLKLIAGTSSAMSFEEGERYICAVCDLPLKLCLSDPTRQCASMILEGTELRLLRRAAREVSQCVSCGTIISTKVLRKNPLAELCSSCQDRSGNSKPTKRSKGVHS